MLVMVLFPWRVRLEWSSRRDRPDPGGLQGIQSHRVRGRCDPQKLSRRLLDCAWSSNLCLCEDRARSDSQKWHYLIWSLHWVQSSHVVAPARQLLCSLDPASLLDNSSLGSHWTIACLSPQWWHVGHRKLLECSLTGWAHVRRAPSWGIVWRFWRRYRLWRCYNLA